MSVPLTSDKFNEYTDCVMVGHLWVMFDDDGLKICDVCSAEEDL